MEFKSIIFEKRDKGIARITINRPEVRNALNRQVRSELKQCLEEIKADPALRVLVLTGAGDKAFIAGADLNDLKVATPLQMDEHASKFGQQLYYELENLPIPSIAMINGFCLGGGLEVALCCDIRVASTNAKLGLPEINVGIYPGGGGTQRLPRMVGWGRAKELLYTGRMMDAAEAERIGLVSRVVPPESLDAETQQLAENIASKAPVTMRILKATVNRGMYTELGAGLGIERANFALVFATEDHLEGINAFLEKRPPQYKGK